MRHVCWMLQETKYPPNYSLNKQPCYGTCLHRAGFIKGAGGISPVDCPGVENVNLSNLIAGHFDYATKIQEIVELLHLE